MVKRGEIENRARSQQIIDYSGLRYGKCTPTDIDGLIELQGEVFIFLEYKYMDADLSYGQKLAFERVVDIMGKHRPSILIHASHSVVDPCNDIDGAEAKVVRFRINEKWWNENKGRTVKELVSDFLKKYKKA